MTQTNDPISSIQPIPCDFCDEKKFAFYVTFRPHKGDPMTVRFCTTCLRELWEVVKETLAARRAKATVASKEGT